MSSQHRRRIRRSEVAAWPQTERGLRFAIVVVFLFACLLGGGSGRPDVQSLLYLRPLAVICLAALLLTPGTWDFSRYRTLFALLALFAATMAIQLVPLPPDLWLALPGHAQYAEAAAAAGIPQPWRPISLTPDLTWNSLVALLPPLAVLVGMAGLDSGGRTSLLPVVLVGVVASALLAIAQLSGGPNGPLYLYRITHNGAGVGFFANRNHQAALLAVAFPLLRLWTLGPARSPDYARVRFWIAVAFGCFLIAAILVTGSRAGVLLGLIGLAFALLLAPIRLPDGDRRWWAALVLALVAAPILLGGIAILSGRAEAVRRLIVLYENYSAEQRLENMPTVLRIAGEFFPFGSGYGSFDSVFRGYETDAMLGPAYYNHAHNDPLELILTGGLPAALVLLAFLLWTARLAYAAAIPYRERSHKTRYARAGAMTILMLFAASLVDYPLRTPLLAALFALACAWLADSRAEAKRATSGAS